MNRIGRERGWPPSGRAEYDALAGPAGPLAIGSPEEVAEKIVGVHELFRPERYLAHLSIGAVEHRDVMRAIELFGTQVAPLVRAALLARASRLKPRSEPRHDHVEPELEAVLRSTAQRAGKRDDVREAVGRELLGDERNSSTKLSPSRRSCSGSQSPRRRSDPT